MLNKSPSLNEFYLGENQISLNHTASNDDELSIPDLNLDDFDNEDLFPQPVGYKSVESDPFILQKQHLLDSSLPPLDIICAKQPDEPIEDPALDPLNFLEADMVTMEELAYPKKVSEFKRAQSPTPPQTEVELDALTCFHELRYMRYTTNQI